MSDTMLLGVLRMPMPDNPDPMTMRQFVDRARQAADRIEADAERIAALEDETSGLYHAVAQEARKVLSLEAVIETVKGALQGVHMMAACGQLDEFLGEPWLKAVSAALRAIEEVQK